MQEGDNKDSGHFLKHGSEAAVMEEQLIVRDNSLEMDPEGIGSDTGQAEDDILPDDSPRIRSDSVDSDLVGLEAELGLLATLSDTETRRRVIAEDCDIFHMNMPTVGDSTDDEQEADDEQDADDDNTSSSASVSADSKEWITLRPDDENLDSSKIAALSSAFSSYISSPKHNKNKQQSSMQDDVDPNIGQFLLPLVTEPLPGQNVTPVVETDHSVIEVLAAEANRFKKAGDEMSALAWRILGEYHASENADSYPGSGATSVDDEEERKQIMQLMSKLMSEDDTLRTFQELNKQLESGEADMDDDHINGMFSKLLQDDTVVNCLSNLETETVNELKKFSDTRLVKSVLRCIDGEKATKEDLENNDASGLVRSDLMERCEGDGESRDESEHQPKEKKDATLNKTFKFLENSPLRSTLEQYMMMQIASREAEAEQNQHLLRELGGITNNDVSEKTSSLSGNSSGDSSLSEEPAQRIFDCDTVNTMSRFIELDDSVDGGNADKDLCPGGCGNVRHCNRYRNNGANHSLSTSISSPSRSLDMDEDQEVLEDGADKEKLAFSEDEEIGRLVDAQSGWWELRALLCALWRAADVGGVACKNVAVATVPPCHCCRCSHPMLRQVPRDVDSSSPENSCQCREQSELHPNQPRERCRSCLTYEAESFMKQVWGGKVDVKVPPMCCCQERRSNRSHNSCVVRLFFKDSNVSTVDFDLSKSEYEKHDLEVDEENSKFLEECHQRYLNGEDDIPRGDEDVVPLCARCRCKCGRAKFYCPKVRNKTIKQNIDNFTRLAPQLLLLRIDTLCSTLCAWHGAHLSRMLTGGAVMTFLIELWRRAAAMRNGGIALSGILGPTRCRLATVCGRLLAPHQYLSIVYRAWADRAAATRVVHLSMLQLLGKAPPQTVEALHSFSSLLTMMNEAETLRGDVTTFLVNYRQCERDDYLISLRFRLVLAQQKNLAIARFLRLLGDDPCELKADKDCESSIVAQRLSECLPTDPSELDEFKRIVQAMLLYHSSGGGVNQLSVRTNSILSDGSRGCKGSKCQAPNALQSFGMKSDTQNNDNGISSDECCEEKTEDECTKTDMNQLSVHLKNTYLNGTKDISSISSGSIKCSDKININHSLVSDSNLKNNTPNSASAKGNSAAVMKRRQELGKEFADFRTIYSCVKKAIDSKRSNDNNVLCSALLQNSKISLDNTNRPRPVKRKFRNSDTTTELPNMCSDSSQPSPVTTVTLRMKQGCHNKAGTKPNRISKSAKGRYIKSIRRASIGHTNEIVKKDPTPITKTVANSPKAVRTSTKRGRSVSLYSETRRYLESAIREYETFCPMNSVQVSGSDSFLRWYSMPDMSVRDSDSDSSAGSAAEGLTSLMLDEDLNRVKNCRQKQTKELNFNLKGLTSKLIPELFIPHQSSVDPFIDIQLKKDFDVYVKGCNKTSESQEVSENNALDKLRKPVFSNETAEQRYLRMQMCECLEKMELLGLDDQDHQNKSNREEDEIASPPLELSPTLESSNMNINLDSQNKRRLLSLNQSLMTGKASDVNSLLCPTGDHIIMQEKNIIKDFIDESKKDNDLSLDDIKLSDPLPFLEISDETNTNQPKDMLDMKIVLSPKNSQMKSSDIENMKNSTHLKQLNEIMKEHGIESNTLKRLLDPVNLIKHCGTKNLWNLHDDLSLLTPETIKQLKEVRQVRMKKQMCGKRKNSKKNSECSLNNSLKLFSDKAQSQAITMEDPTKEEIMIEMLEHRHKKKGFKNAKEFQTKLFSASLQVVMRKVLQVLMPCDEDIELENLKKAGKLESVYDVKVGNQIDGCNIDDYWDDIKSQFSSWRAYTLEQYWNLPEHCREAVDTLKSQANSQDSEIASNKNQIETISSMTSTQADQKKRTIIQMVTSKAMTLDTSKAKSYLTPVEHALFVERLQAVNKDYVDKLLKQNLTGEDWIFAMNELQNLERKLKNAVKGKPNTLTNSSTGSSRMVEETREAELLAGRGLSKLINQFSKKTKDTKQDLNAKSPKPSSTVDATKTEKNKTSTVGTTAPNQATKTDSNNATETKHREDSKKQIDLTDKQPQAPLKPKEDVKKAPGVHCAPEKVKTVLVSGKARPIIISQSESSTKSAPHNVNAPGECPTDNNTCKRGKIRTIPVCAEHIAQIRASSDEVCEVISDDDMYECCHGCGNEHTNVPEPMEDAVGPDLPCDKMQGEVANKDNPNKQDKLYNEYVVEGFLLGLRSRLKYIRNLSINDEDEEEQNPSEGDPLPPTISSNNEQSTNANTSTNSAVEQQSEANVPCDGAVAGSKGKTEACGHVQSACKGDHHHHHQHQHTCSNANQREMETCANHNPSDVPNRCSQHSGSSRGAGANHTVTDKNGSSNGTSDQPCNCCYCTVFGHAPPMTTPVSKNFNETRERLRSILNRKKQRCRPGSMSSQGGGDSDVSDGKANVETPSIIPMTPMVKPDPLPISTMPKQKPPPQIATTATQPQAEAIRSNCMQPESQQAPAVKTTQQATNVKPIQLANKLVAQQPNTKANIDISQKPNLPLKLKIKQSEGQIAIQDMIKKDTETVKTNSKETVKSVASKINPPNVATVGKTADVPIQQKEPMKINKESLNEVKTTPANTSNVPVAKVADKKQIASITVKREKCDVVPKQAEATTNAPVNNAIPIISKKDQEKEVEEQNLRNAKKQKIDSAVNESKGIQTEKPRSQSLQTNGNPQMHRTTTIQKTGPQPLQQQTKRSSEQNKAKVTSVTRNNEVQNPASSTTSRDCSVFSTSTVCSGCSVDPRDLDMLMDFIEGPGSVMDKIKKKAKKARQKVKKVIEKLREKLSKFEVKAAQLRGESNKLDKLLVATVGKKKKPTKKGKKKNETSEVEDESVVALRRTAREYRDAAAQAEKELEDGRRMLNRVAKALLLIGSTEDISQLPEFIAVQQQVSLMSSLEEKEEMDSPTLLPQHVQDLERAASIKQQQQQQQQTRQASQTVDNSRSASLDQILANSLQRQNGPDGKPPSQCMVTIKRVMMPESGEPSVTITPKGSDKPIYTFQNHSGPATHQQQPHYQSEHGGSMEQPQEAAMGKKRNHGPSWESTLAQINSLSQGKKKTKKGDPETEQPQQTKENKSHKKQESNVVVNNNEKDSSSVSSSLYPSRSTSTVSELSNVDVTTTLNKKQRKQLAKKLKQEEEERERNRLEEEHLSAQKGGNKKNKGGKHKQEDAEDDPDPEKIVLSMRQLKTAVKRALEAMDSDERGQKLQGKGKLKDNAKEFIEKVVSKVEETKKATTTQSNPSGKRVDKVVDISEVVLGSFSGKMASATAKLQKQPQKNSQQPVKGANAKQNSNQQQQQQNVGKKQKGKDVVANDGLNVVAGKGVIKQEIKKTSNGKKNQGIPSQPVTSVHHRTTPLVDYNKQQQKGNNFNQQLNENYMDKINLNTDITIQLANQNEENADGTNVNIKPGGPVSCSIMEQLRNGVQVPDLRLPPGITLTWVDPNKKIPDPTPKAAIPVVKLSSVAPEYRPTPPVVAPPPLIMVDTKNIPHNRDPKAQLAQSAQVTNQQLDANKSKSKKTKKKSKKPPANLIQQTETSTHSHPRAEEHPKMVTLRNPMFHPTLPSVSLSSVQQSGQRVSQNIRIPDPIPMPPNVCQATITPTSNGMFTIRNPLMSMVHQQNMMAMKETPIPSTNTPVVLMSSTGSVLATDINKIKDHSVNVDLAGRMADIGLKKNAKHQQISPPTSHQNKEETNQNTDFLSQNLSFTPNKDNSRSYSLFQSEEGNVPSPSNHVIGHVTQESNVCPSPIGSKTNRSTPGPANASRQLDFNKQLGIGGWQDCPVSGSQAIKKPEELSNDSSIDGCPPGFYTPFGQADSDKLFGSLLFQNPSRDEHLQQTMWSSTNLNDEQLLRSQTHYPKMDLHSNSVEIGIAPTNMDNNNKQSNQPIGSNGTRPQPAPVGYGGKNTSLWNGPYNYHQQQDYPQSTQTSTFYQPPANNVYTQNYQTPINPNYQQVRSSHSSSSSGLMTGSVISSGTNSVYDSVSNSSSNSPADATNQDIIADVTNLQQSSPDGRNYIDYSTYVSALQQQQPQGNNFNAFGRVTDSPGTAERMAELFAANRDRLNELGWYTMGNQARSMSDTFNQLRLSDEQNFLNQQSRLSADFNADLAYYNAQRMQNAATANSFSPKSSNSNTEAFRATNKLNADALQLDEDTGLPSKYGSFGVIGQGKQQQSGIGAEEGQAVKNLGAIGSHRTGSASNGVRQEEYYSGWGF